MDQWLDSLSEDWPSQPPSQHNSSSLLQDYGSPKSNGSQSRIPRRTASSVSSLNGKEQGRRVSAHRSDSAKAALKERTSSSLNISQKRQSNGSVKPQSLGPEVMQNRTRNPSEASTPSMPAGTVAYKASPVKENHETPEWKRRVVQGKIGPGDQTDMFGPMGLQSVFKPPTLALRPKQKQKKHDLQPQKPAEPVMPSSPPGPLLPAPESDSRNPVNSPRQSPVEAEIVEEWDHDGSVVIYSEQQDYADKETAADDGSPVIAQNSATKSSKTSTSKPASNLINESPNGSGFDQSNSNDFTPFYVSKSHTIDGKVDYAAIDMGMKRLHSNMEKSRLSQDNPSLHSEENQSHITDKETLGISFRKSQMNEITNQSLPEDLSVGTDAFAANGGFVSLHRGGYSNEGSFQKRPLSPSSSNVTDGPSGNFTRASSQALPSPQHSHRKLRRPSTSPKTPKKDDEERPRSSGSPLKLFDKYDTFTNNRLARHISRFEETLAQDGTPEGISEDDLQPSSPSPGPKVSRKPSWTKEFVEYLPSRRISRFGSGELDEHDFNANESGMAESLLPYYSRDDVVAQPLPGRRRGKKALHGNRRPSRTDPMYPASASDHEDVEILGDEESVLQSNQRTQEPLYTANRKRLPNSPEKHAARKRRRTLCSSEERKRVTLNAQPQSHPSVKETPATAVHGRKRKDARYDSERQAADPKILAMRQILRPRNPTPSQSGSSAHQRPFTQSEHPHITITGYGRISAGRDVDTDSRLEVDPPTQIVAGALATIALNTVQDMESGSRKASVTTADFFNEAQQIMTLIRAEKRPRSSHNSAATSKMGHSLIHEEPSIVDSTKDDLTRPPSREGGSLRRMQVPAQHDARAVSHLRKFEDKDELGLALPSSGKSLRISNCDIASAASPARPKNEEQKSEDESDPPNIRIRLGNSEDRQREHSPSSPRQSDRQMGTDNDKVNSQDSSGSSTGKSIPTGSSRGSSNMKKIAPQSVAHLLSDQMADMFFDKERQLWIKRKVSTDSASFNAEAPVTSEETEEDLFGDIPDLSVDEMEELRRVREVVSTRNTLSLGGSTTSKHDYAPQPGSQKDGSSSQDTEQDARPHTADGKVIPLAENSSAPSKYTNFAWSGPMPGTRATSYGDDVWPDKTAQQQRVTLSAIQNGPPSPEAEHEISMLEGRGSHVAEQEIKGNRQPRVVTVAFSSPLIQSPYQPDEDWERCDESRLEDSPSRHASQSQNSAKRPSSSGFSRGQRRASRRLSIGNSSFIARPMSRLDEQNEMSLVHYSTQRPQTTLDLTISTPLALSRSLMVPPTTSQRSSIGFKLSPLPDFTVHQIDRPLDTEGVIVRQQRWQEVSNFLSLTAQELVKHLTDMEPYEPYWDHLPTVVLRDRGLTSLHMLDEFCGRTHDLDVSRNRIRELDGVPSNVRSLNIRENCLSDLTAWHTLLHLQYLDVSGNQLQSLVGFQGLLHLRSLKADDNEIRSLDGIEYLNGLLSLSLRNNRLSVVDFERFNLKRLSDLDLYRNSLAKVANLEELCSLETLNLSMNGLESLHLNSSMPKLRTIDIADNCLTCFDVGPTPNLRKLVLDRNTIDQVEGLITHGHLETLLWREQDIFAFDNQYQGCHEIRNLYLSSNSLPILRLETPFLNLNTLEIASMGLQSLPENLGLMCRNLRTLNLNYNAIHDIRPLLCIPRLQKLYLAGNRLSRLRRTATVLGRLSAELLEVDLRNNTLTVGFYTPQPSCGAKETRVVIHDTTSSHDFDEDDEDQSAKAHLLPYLDKDADNLSRERLDEDTKLRRRVYEMLLVNACRSLRRLDGLEVDRSIVARKDDVWNRLVELGVLKKKTDWTVSV